MKLTHGTPKQQKCVASCVNQFNTRFLIDHGLIPVGLTLIVYSLTNLASSSNKVLAMFQSM